MPARRRPSRRFLLRGALAAMGLAGSGVAAKLAIAGESGAEGREETGRHGAAGLPATLYLDRYTLHSSGPKAERHKGDQSLLRGTLITEAGERAGELFASSITMPGPVDDDSPRTPRMEIQTLHLEGGTVMALGTVFAQSDIPNVYMVVGGTGLYAGIRGTYRFDENPNVARPQGRAMIAFDLLV